MKALTLRQPWAQLVAIGAKRIETRSWETRYRGPLAIHAASVFPKEGVRFSLTPECYGVMATLGYKTRSWFPAYPLGAVLCTCELVDCVRVRELCYGPDGEPEGIIGKYTQMLFGRPQERAFGNFEYGRFAWILRNVECFERPIPAKGNRRIWNWERPTR